MSLQLRHNGRDGVLNHQPRDCLLNRIFRRRSKKTPKLRVTGLCAGNSPVTGEFPAQRAINAEMFPFDDVIMVTQWVDRFCCECDSLRKLHVLNSTGSVMSSTWILDFVWICSIVLIDFLDIVLLITVRFGLIGIWKLAGIHCKHWVYFYGYVFWICHSGSFWLRNDGVWKPTISTCFKGVLSCQALTNSLRTSKAIWQLWQRWPIWWHVARRPQAITWTNGDLLSVNTSVTHLWGISMEVPWRKVPDALNCFELNWITTR